MSRQVAAVTSLLVLLTCLLVLWPGVSSAQSSRLSQSATWTCTGSPCPWGAALSGQALVWPAELGPTSARLGYTTSSGVYLPGSTATGMTIRITSGTAGVYAGLPNAGSHRQVAALAAGQSYLVGGLAAGEVVSVQADQVAFGYTLTLPTATPTVTQPPTATSTRVPPATATPFPTATPTLIPATATLLPTATSTLVPATATLLPTATPTLVPATATPFPTATPTLVPATATPLPTATPTLAPTATVPPQSSGLSQSATWTCTGNPCPWGAALSGQALVWPAALGPTTSRLGYTTSTGVYLPGSAATGMTIRITSGTAGVYAGLPNAGSHRQLAALAAGQSYLVGGLPAGEVVSVQADQVAFGYTLTLPTATPPATATLLPTATPTLAPPATATPFPTATPTLVPPATATLLPTATPTLVPATVTPLPTATPTLVPATATSLPTATPTRAPATATPFPTATPTLVPATATPLPTATPTLVPPATVPPQSSGSSQSATWTCTGSPCPWGAALSGQALAWPAALGPTTARLGYTTSTGVYLPGSTAAGMTIRITSGTAGVYAGLPNAGSHRQVAALAAGQTYLVGGPAAGEVVSVQADEVVFGYALALPTATPPATATPFPTATPTLVPPATATPLPTESATPLPIATLTPPPTATPAGCVDPMACNPVSSINGFWKCNITGCRESDWIGAAINWPSWAAYSTNARAGGQSRTVYSAQGELLYPYMGAWANGCQVTAVTGPVLIIEWKRGTDVWRETHLSPGQTHTISLRPTEDGAMIESNTWEAFSVILNNCNPQSIETAPPPSVVEPAPVGAAAQPEVGGAANIGPRLFLPLVSP